MQLTELQKRKQFSRQLQNSTLSRCDRRRPLEGEGLRDTMIRGTRAVLPLACFRVAARVRPLSSRERAAGEVAAVCATGAQTVSVVDGGGVGGAQEFTFDAVFDGSSSQADVFDEVRDAISLALDGVNCTVFAYGATGSGKTFTLFGETAGEAGEMVGGELLLSGVLPRAAALVFDAAAVRRRAEEEGGDGTYAAVAVSVLQLYREQLGDLLHERRADHGELQDARLRVRVSPPGAVEVEHLTKLPVASAAEVMAAVARGRQQATVEATRMGARSSRAHLVVTLHFESRDGVAGSVPRRSKLHFVDLAGSEHSAPRAGVAQQGAVLREASRICRSGAAVERVLLALAGGVRHVPFRDSKLTHLLSDSLLVRGGRPAAVLLVTLSPCVLAGSQEEAALPSLRFASRVCRGVFQRECAAVPAAEEPANVGACEGGGGAACGAGAGSAAVAAAAAAAAPPAPPKRLAAGCSGSSSSTSSSSSDSDGDEKA